MAGTLTVQKQANYRFDPDNHLHTVDGKRITSVTTAIRSAGLIDAAKYAPGSAAHGNHVHVVTELWDLYSEETADLRALQYLDGWRKFREDKQFTPTEVEHACCNMELGYAGVIDRIGRTPEYPRILLDIKSGAKEPWHALQTAAYAAMLPHPFQIERWCVYLRPDSTYQIEIHSRANLHADLAVFLSCLSIHNFKERNGNRSRSGVGE